VSSTQELLNGKGASLTVDGDFGPLTTTATKNFQSSKGLTVGRTTAWRTLACQTLSWRHPLGAQHATLVRSHVASCLSAG
jgi:peptidoglycan hydrolase-like protein with peptidoglycan-binding domain